jgi:hypothetical protein
VAQLGRALLLTVAILVTACVGPTASETPAPYFETPDRMGACDLIVAMAPVMAYAAEAATMADKRVLLDRASLATLGTRARAIRLSFAAQDQAVPPGRTKRSFQMLWSYLGPVEDLGIMLGSGTGDATRLDDLAKAAGAFGGAQRLAVGADDIARALRGPPRTAKPHRRPRA